MRKPNLKMQQHLNTYKNLSIMTTLGLNEKFILSFLITKSEKEDTAAQLEGRRFSISKYRKAPAMLEVQIEVWNIADAQNLMDNLKTSHPVS